jgi:hypothetical protein
VDPLPFALYLPLVFLGLGYAVLYVAGRVMVGRGEHEGGDRLLDIAFVLALIAAGYVVVLVIVSLIFRPVRVGEMLLITIILSVFFLVLLFAFFGLFEVLFSRGGRSGGQRAGSADGNPDQG